MWRKGLTILTVVLAMLMTGSTLMAQQQVQRDRSNTQSDDYNYDEDQTGPDRSYDDQYQQNDYVAIDRNLDADIWVNRGDNEYFIGDNIKMHYRLSTDAYVAIVSIDSRGRVNLLYPAKPSDNPWRRGGVTYTLPGADDDFDLIVDGPEGNESVQIIASRERFPIPNWFEGSGIRCEDDEDRDEFMDYLISRYFHRYPEQRFAVDRDIIYVNEWEPDYFRPVYYPTYPSWSVCGNVYFDYPWGASIYIDGTYWGCAPMYIPRILVGWRTITIYDRYGYCWEDYVHVSHYNTIVLNQTVIRPRVGVVSKYKEVREVGFRDPVKAGYKNYNDVVSKHTRVVSKTTVSPRNGVTQSKPGEDDASNFTAFPKKHVRGDGAVIKTDRGLESAAVGNAVEKRRAERQRTTSRFDGERPSSGYRSSTKAESGSSSKNSGYTTRKKTESSSSSGTSDYYRKRSGSVDRQPEATERKEPRQSQPQQTEQRKPESKGSDNSSSHGRSGGEAKQKSSGSDNSGGEAKATAPRSGGSENKSGDRSGGRGKR